MKTNSRDGAAQKQLPLGRTNKLALFGDLGGVQHIAYDLRCGWDFPSVV